MSKMSDTPIRFPPNYCEKADSGRKKKKTPEISTEM